MHRTEADGNVSGLYTEGDAAQGIPATVFGADAANAIQEEIVNAITRAGLTISSASLDSHVQLGEAIEIFAQKRGQLTPLTGSLDNNQVDTDLLINGGTILLNNLIVSSFYDFHISIGDSSESYCTSGKLSVYLDTFSNQWRISYSFDSEEEIPVEFKLTQISPSTAKITYTTKNFTGTGYTGDIKLFNNRKIEA